jgi:hypothetical protein
LRLGREAHNHFDIYFFQNVSPLLLRFFALLLQPHHTSHDQQEKIICIAIVSTASKRNFFIVNKLFILRNLFNRLWNRHTSINSIINNKNKLTIKHIAIIFPKGGNTTGLIVYNFKYIKIFQVKPKLTVNVIRIFTIIVKLTIATYIPIFFI